MDHGEINQTGVKRRNKTNEEEAASEQQEEVGMTSNNNVHSDKSDQLAKELAHKKLRASMQKLQVELMAHLSERLGEMTSEVLREVEGADLAPHQRHHVGAEHTKYKNRIRKSDKPGALPDKQFLARNSLLTDLFEIPHIRTIYNIFIVILIILFLNSFIDDILAGNLQLSVGFIQWCFGGMRAAASVWLAMFASTLGVFACFTLWAEHRSKMHASVLGRVWDYGWLAVFVCYQCCLLYLPVTQLVHHRLPPATAIALLLEQVRLVMKSHAFVRSNAPKAWAHTATLSPDFQHFLYFMFCPTLVYRDAYPRTKSIRWSVVAWHLLEVIGVVFYMSFIFERFLVPSHRDFGLTASTHEHRIVLVFGAMLPGMLAYLCGFYCLLHAWMNACAEMTRFADRMFYQDWWNARSYGAFYRRWNVVVHDWLYTYIYKDVCEVLCPRNRLVPTVVVFAVSAIVHEYILAFTFGFFYPMLMITFGFFGMSLVFITSDHAKGGNIFMWLCLSTGTGLMASVYCMEWYARINCAPTQQDALTDFLVPRSWTCLPTSASKLS